MSTDEKPRKRVFDSVTKRYITPPETDEVDMHHPAKLPESGDKITFGPEVNREARRRKVRAMLEI